MLITSQHYLDDAIVADKIAAEDFEVLVSPEFEYDGMTLQVILDGHHSYAAAKEAGVAPVIVVADPQDNDKVALLEQSEIEAFLEAAWMDGDYINAVSGKYVW